MTHNQFSIPAQHFLARQIAHFHAAPSGRRAGNELEFPVTFAAPLAPHDALALENALTEAFIAVWNHEIAQSPHLSHDPAWVMHKKTIVVSPLEIADILAAYRNLLTLPVTDGGPVAEHLSEIHQGFLNMQAFENTGFVQTGVTNNLIHPDNHRLIEIIAPPFADPFDPVLTAFAKTVTHTIDVINRIFAGRLTMHVCAVADHGRQELGHKVHIPGAELPLSRLLASRHVLLQNPSVANGSIAMAHGGLHVTAGLVDKERLGDILRVLVAVTPTLMVLTENNGLDPDFAVRLLHGSWLGQNPANYPRMGAKFFQPTFSATDVITEYWTDIFKSPVIVALSPEGQDFNIDSLHPPHFAKTVDADLAELWDALPQHDQRNWDNAIRHQSKTWGLYRIRDITEGGEVLVEYRPLDTQTPENALVIQAIVQTLMQDATVLDQMLTHFEAINVIPQRGEVYTKDALQTFESRLRETALQALSGRGMAGEALEHQGLATPYLGSPDHFLVDTAIVLHDLIQQTRLPQDVADFVFDRIVAHQNQAVALWQAQCVDLRMCG